MAFFFWHFSTSLIVSASTAKLTFCRHREALKGTPWFSTTCTRSEKLNAISWQTTYWLRFRTISLATKEVPLSSYSYRGLKTCGKYRRETMVSPAFNQMRLESSSLVCSMESPCTKHLMLPLTTSTQRATTSVRRTINAHRVCRLFVEC